jgi:hypothetical protein
MRDPQLCRRKKRRARQLIINLAAKSEISRQELDKILSIAPTRHALGCKQTSGRQRQRNSPGNKSRSALEAVSSQPAEDELRQT